MGPDRRFVSFDLFSTLVDLDDTEDDAAFGRFAAEMSAAGVDAPADWWRDRKRELTAEAFERAPQPLDEGGDIDVSEIFAALVVEATAGRARDTYDIARLAAHRFRRCATVSLTPVPEVVAALPILSEDFTLLLISNTQRCYSELEMDRFGLRQWFDAVVFSSDVGMCKPRPAMFERGLAAVGARPDQWLHVGDNPLDDARGAMSAGGAAIVLVRPDRPSPQHAVLADIEHEVESVVTLTRPGNGRSATTELVDAIRSWSQ